MKAEPPLQRRKFANDWDEIEYLYQKLLFWLYERADACKGWSIAVATRRKRFPYNTHKREATTIPINSPARKNLP